jgi:hypothetical protein
MNRLAILRSVAALAMLAALLVIAAPAGAQATTGTITIHSRLCPAGQPTTDIFTDCHSHLPTIATSYSLDGGAAQAVGADGNTAFTDVSAGAHEIAQVEGVPLDFAHLRVFCANNTDGSAATEVSVDVNKFSVDAVAGANVICDVYTIQENASGLTPTAVPTTSTGGNATSGNGTSLPNTGVGPSNGGGNTGLEVGLLALAASGLGFAALRRRGARQR